jgi:hypothetical protein
VPIVSPQLDDLTYDRVVAELTRRIPVYSPEWTDFNDSDPGITLIQLFAYLAEMVGYRLNRIPEKTQINLLRLLGVELNPAHAATTRLALLLADPTTLTSYTLAQGASAKASIGSPPPAFETDQAIDIVPAETVVLVTTKFDDIRNPIGTDPPSPSVQGSDYLTLVWDGQSPKLKDMPLGPVTLAPVAAQRYLWLGLSYNDALGAGFRGTQVTVTIQFDDDEQPSFTATCECGPQAVPGEAGVQITWLSYYDTQADGFLPVTGQIDDTTNQLANSGTLSFTVPLTIGPIPAGEFKPLYTPPPGPTPLQACTVLATNINDGVKTIPAIGTGAGQIDVPTWIGQYTTALSAAVSATASAASGSPAPPVPNPLDPKYYPTMGWFRIALQAVPAAPLATAKLRIATFNAVPVTNATTVTNELLSVADGTPGQSYQLANTNIQPGTLQLAVQESPQSDNAPLVAWTVVDSLDPYGPNDRVGALDPEAGMVTFGDGINGRIVPLVPQGGQIVALIYRWGGGESGNVAVGAITTLNSSGAGISGVVNFVAATGGEDAETLDAAEIRARKDLSTRSRAVTAADFAWIASQTPTVEVARALVVPLRLPLDASTSVTPVTSTPCGAAVPTVAAGLADTIAAGVVSVIVVPQQADPEPTPTPSFLNAVCQYLDAYRLVTTEVYVVPPQYARLCNMQVSVKGQPGYTRAQLQTLVSAQLSTYLHVLTGGDAGTGYDFGDELHIADLIAQVYRVSGVERVDNITASFVRTKSNASPRHGSLVLCPSGPTQYDHLSLAPEENVSFNADTFLLSTVS